MPATLDMNSPAEQEASQKDVCRSWVMYCTSKEEIPKIQRAMDSLFAGYSFYPEVDWIQYGYRPPEGHQVLGAWRHPETKLFAFLLDNPRIRTIKPAVQVLVYVAGEVNEIARLEEKLKTLKTSIALEYKKVTADSAMGERLGRVNDSRHFAVLTSVLTVLTAIINGFSLYLRQLPPPQLSGPWVLAVYAFAVAAVHFAALLLLMLVALIVAAFLIRYGMLLIRSM